MPKPLLISWIAVFNDFMDGMPLQANRQGPHFLMHRHHYDGHAHAPAGYERHILLFSHPDGRHVGQRPQLLRRELCEAFPDRPIETRNLDLSDEDLHDFRALLLAIERLLHELAKEGRELHILCGPGSRLMQMVWMAAYASTGLPIRLFQLERPWAMPKPDKPPGLLPINADAEHLRQNLHRRQAAETRRQGRGRSATLRDELLERLYTEAAHAAKADQAGVHFLIGGPTGAGKEELAKHLWQHSPRRQGNDDKLLSINCAALPDETLYSELFGHKKGAFTGASAEREGLFKAADGKILFLDEIGDISPFMQQALLRVLQDGSFRPLGSNHSERSQVQVIAASNRDLEAACAEGRFRWDLYYRLAVVTFHVPALVDRPPSLRWQMLEQMSHHIAPDFPPGQPLRFSPEAEALLRAHTWPGNFRELRNLLLRLYVLARPGQPPVPPSALPAYIREGQRREPLSFDEAIRAHFERIYRRNGHNMAATARDLGYSNPHVLKQKMIKLGVDFDALR